MKTIVLANDKGGVAKTTSVINLAVGLVGAGKKVLAIDLDGQANMTSVLVGHKDSNPTVFEYLTGKGREAVKLEDVLITDLEEGVHLIPSDNQMKSAEVHLGRMIDSQRLLLHKMREIEPLGYDYVIIDTPPTSTLVKLLGLFCADVVVAPITPEDFSVNGLEELVSDLAIVSDALGRGIDFRVLLCKTDYTRMTQNIKGDLRENGVAEYMFATEIPLNTSVREASRRKQSVLKYAPDSKGAIAYANLVKEVIKL